MYVRLIKTGKRWPCINPSFALAVGHALLSALQILMNVQLRMLSPVGIRVYSAMSRQDSYRLPKSFGGKIALSL
jgi:hypothetical protein